MLRDSGFATVRPDGARRLYAVDAAPLREVDEWLDRFRRFWDQRLDSLATELARGKRERRLAAAKHAERRADPMIDIVREIEAIQREVGTGRLAAGEGRARPPPAHYDAPIEDVWDAMHEPGPDQPLVPADQRRLPRRRPVPVRGQRRRRDRRMRAAEPAQA